MFNAALRISLGIRQLPRNLPRSLRLSSAKKFAESLEGSTMNKVKTEEVSLFIPTQLMDPKPPDAVSSTQDLPQIKEECDRVPGENITVSELYPDGVKRESGCYTTSDFTALVVNTTDIKQESHPNTFCSAVAQEVKPETLKQEEVSNPDVVRNASIRNVPGTVSPGALQSMLASDAVHSLAYQRRYHPPQNLADTIYDHVKDGPVLDPVKKEPAELDAKGESSQPEAKTSSKRQSVTQHFTSPNDLEAISDQAKLEPDDEKGTSTTESMKAQESEIRAKKQTILASIKAPILVQSPITSTGSSQVVHSQQSVKNEQIKAFSQSQTIPMGLNNTARQTILNTFIQGVNFSQHPQQNAPRVILVPLQRPNIPNTVSSRLNHGTIRGPLQMARPSNTVSAELQHDLIRALLQKPNAPHIVSTQLNSGMIEIPLHAPSTPNTVASQLNHGLIRIPLQKPSAPNTVSTELYHGQIRVPLQRPSVPKTVSTQLNHGLVGALGMSENMLNSSVRQSWQGLIKQPSTSSSSVTAASSHVTTQVTDTNSASKKSGIIITKLSDTTKCSERASILIDRSNPLNSILDRGESILIPTSTPGSAFLVQKSSPKNKSFTTGKSAIFLPESDTTCEAIDKGKPTILVSSASEIVKALGIPTTQDDSPAGTPSKLRRPQSSSDFVVKNVNSSLVGKSQLQRPQPSSSRDFVVKNVNSSLAGKSQLQRPQPSSSRDRVTKNVNASLAGKSQLQRTQTSGSRDCVTKNVNASQAGKSQLQETQTYSSLDLAIDRVAHNVNASPAGNSAVARVGQQSLSAIQVKSPIKPTKKIGAVATGQSTDSSPPCVSKNMGSSQLNLPKLDFLLSDTQLNAQVSQEAVRMPMSHAGSTGNSSITSQSATVIGSENVSQTQIQDRNVFLKHDLTMNPAMTVLYGNKHLFPDLNPPIAKTVCSKPSVQGSDNSSKRKSNQPHLFRNKPDTALNHKKPKVLDAKANAHGSGIKVTKTNSVSLPGSAPSPDITKQPDKSVFPKTVGGSTSATSSPTSKSSKKRKHDSTKHVSMHANAGWVLNGSKLCSTDIAKAETLLKRRCRSAEDTKSEQLERFRKAKENSHKPPNTLAYVNRVVWKMRAIVKKNVIEDKKKRYAHTKRHVTRMKRGTVDGSLPTCLSCGLPCDSRFGLTRHVARRHVPKLPRKCKVCGHLIKTATFYQYHQLKHSRVRPFACHYCPKRFKQIGPLQVHIIRHRFKTVKGYDRCGLCGLLVQSLADNKKLQPFPSCKCVAHSDIFSPARNQSQLQKTSLSSLSDCVSCITNASPTAKSQPQMTQPVGSKDCVGHNLGVAGVGQQSLSTVQLQSPVSSNSTSNKVTMRLGDLIELIKKASQKNLPPMVLPVEKLGPVATGQSTETSCPKPDDGKLIAPRVKNGETVLTKKTKPADVNILAGLGKDSGQPCASKNIAVVPVNSKLQNLEPIRLDVKSNVQRSEKGVSIPMALSGNTASSTTSQSTTVLGSLTEVRQTQIQDKNACRKHDLTMKSAVNPLHGNKDLPPNLKPPVPKTVLSQSISTPPLNQDKNLVTENTSVQGSAKSSLLETGNKDLPPILKPPVPKTVLSQSISTPPLNQDKNLVTENPSMQGSAKSSLSETAKKKQSQPHLSGNMPDAASNHKKPKLSAPKSNAHRSKKNESKSNNMSPPGSTVSLGITKQPDKSVSSRKVGGSTSTTSLLSSKSSEKPKRISKKYIFMYANTDSVLNGSKLNSNDMAKAEKLLNRRYRSAEDVKSEQLSKYRKAKQDFRKAPDALAYVNKVVWEMRATVKKNAIEARRKRYADAMRRVTRMKRGTTDGSLPKCLSCCLPCDSRFGLTRHVARRHVPKLPRKCKVCGHLIKTATFYQYHQLKHSRLRPFACHYCPERFKQIGALQIHIIRHRFKTVRKYDKCGMCGLFVKSLVDHIELHFKRKPKKQKVRTCRICKKTMAANLLKEHKKSCKRVFKCETCGKTFTAKWSLQCHVKTVHNPEKIKQCQVCGLVFPNQQRLDWHSKRAHSNKRSFQCHVCGKLFSTESKLETHVETHEEPIAWQCEHCGEMLKNKRKLESHYLTHRTGSLFQCDLCGNSYRTQQALTAHRKRHTVGKPYQCDICMRKFHHRFLLKRHLRVHTGDLVSCPVCEKKFISETHLIKHKRRHQLRARIPCDLCHATFKSKRGLTRHMCRAHEMDEDRVTAQVLTTGMTFKEQFLRKTRRRHLRSRGPGPKSNGQPGTKPDRPPGHKPDRPPRHKPDRPPVPKPDRPPSRCEICDVEYQKPSSLIRHRQKFHERKRTKYFVKVETCATCGKKVIGRTVLAKHIRDCHGSGKASTRSTRSSGQTATPDNADCTEAVTEKTPSSDEEAHSPTP